jgi:hypothetical protein
MSIVAEDSAVIAKTRELCAQIASDPSFLKLQADVERFLADDAARLLGATEIREFESAREALFENEVARNFLSAQRELEGLQKEIGKYVGTTIELGRVPSAEDLIEKGGCCGGGGGGGCCG